MHKYLTHGASDYINGEFISLVGEKIISENPANPKDVCWKGSPNNNHVHLAIEAASDAFKNWSLSTFEYRLDVLRNWQKTVESNKDRLAQLITDEMGKIYSESIAEVNIVISCLDTILNENSMRRVLNYELNVNKSRTGYCRFRPYGVMSVIGPFNFPVHLPNWHWIPALLLGNTVVFKPSDKTPGVGQLVAELMHESKVPPGVFNVIQGDAETARMLVSDPNVNGVLFTGSWSSGRSILELTIDKPGKIIALEMGGNNPVVIMPDAQLDYAIIECVRSCFATTGQRCTSTRRIIIHKDIYKKFVSGFTKVAQSLKIGSGNDKDVFMGPLISKSSLLSILNSQDKLIKKHNANSILPAQIKESNGYFISPGILEVDSFNLEIDEEIFGPIAQLSQFSSFDDAIIQANSTNYGLAASIFTSNELNFERFLQDCNAGCINQNLGTAGASNDLPFGGTKHSGNHRPAGSFSVDYCVYPVASLVESDLKLPVLPGAEWNPDWMDDSEIIRS